MLQILVNGYPTELGAPLPSIITSLSISFQSHPFIPTKIPLNQIPTLKLWLNQLLDNCTCEFLAYNNTLQEVGTLSRFPKD